MSSDYSQQEPKICAVVSNDTAMIEGFKKGQDAYATIASVSFNRPYEECLEFHPETHEYQPDGKARRSQAKTILLGVLYGRSIPSIADQLYGKNKEMTEEQKIKGAQKVYDAVMNAFPGLRDFMINSQARCHKLGYTETILGRRRHLPDMTLEEFEFEAMPGYVNPDVNPLDPSTLENTSQIPERIIKSLQDEFKRYKYFGQIVKRTKELAEQKIKVINNRAKINDATREVVNCVDYETEILTLDGWKHYNEISPGDSIYAYDTDEHKIVKSHVEHVHNYPGEHKTYEFKSKTFSAVTTPEHRWPVASKNSNSTSFITSEDMYNLKFSERRLVVGGDSSFASNSDWTGVELFFAGLWLSQEFDSWNDATIKICIKGSRDRVSLVKTLHGIADGSDIKLIDVPRGGYLYLTVVGPFRDKLAKTFPERKLTHSFVSSLSQRQAKCLVNGILQDNMWDFTSKPVTKFRSGNKHMVDIFQHACLIAGWSSYTTYSPREGYTLHQSCSSYTSLRLISKTETTSDGVWCVTTPQSTWIARRNGQVYVTGNSIIQGSAADLTKMAILELCNDPRWQRLGGRLLIPVHDELICEVPLEYRKEAEEILADCMCRAATFMPFEISCDVETTFRWYGLPVDEIMSFDRPESLDSEMTESNIKWIQSRLCEMEYPCPVFKDEEGNKPRGIAAKGVNGIWSDDLDKFISDYIQRHGIPRNSFLDDIDRRVLYAY